MSKILLLEDKEDIVYSFMENFEALDLGIELIHCKDYEAYKIEMQNHHQEIKCLVMDLANNIAEESSHEYQSLQFIRTEYEKNRIPIFIHSGFLGNLEDFENSGTIKRVAKTGSSVTEIVQSIKNMEESGFLDIFSLGGSLDKKIMSEIHKAFVSQFKPNEIEEIIKSIKSANPDDLENRTKVVFERIALRALYQNIISNVENTEDVKVNSIEHYYRRTDGKDFWTGDIFKQKETNELLFVATPRCNISNGNYEQILLCKINPIKEDQANSFLNPKIDNKETGETKGLKSLRTSITDDVTNAFIGERFRFLPKTPQFEGGFVDFIKYTSVENLDNFDYVISLVDDLTNDVVRKLAAYLLRGGISDTAYKEALYYFQQIEGNNS